MGTKSIFLGTRSNFRRVLRLLVALVAVFAMSQFVSLYLNWPRQMVLGGCSVVAALVLDRVSKSQVVTLGLMVLSLVATLRYGWWRVETVIQYFMDQSHNRVTIDAFLMLVLLSAEAYTILIMVLGFMQTSAPLKRKPIPLPADESLWPHVDVLIPTYNEPLSLVRYTALASVNIDYPPEKLHVYVLDDGTRPEFRQFCEEVGVGYVVRTKHDHAKAGNINHALTKMTSELVTIFDCDHVPTRSFLQMTVGWFLAQEKLGILQTPHHFYSPDPFERNLLQYRTIPNEGELFYGIIQDGNDLWNATFFCGSCAVIRRKALNEVGGIAVETVTEDAHTSLRLQRRGWNTAYINMPQAAGLATETLAAHVGQRVRWARGMVQILRTENPLFASGLKLTQRLCYFEAMLHFMYAVPRLIFLCSPLIYMLAGRSIIPGYWLAILAYAMPHLVLSSMVNSRVQGRHRHSFWNEIYETVLAPYILMPTILALINPKLGTFNVTDKGNTLAESRFDTHIAAPTVLLLILNFLGVCVAPYRFLVTDADHSGTVISNLVWILFNMVILGVAAAVAHEKKQLRRSVRINLRIPVRLHMTDGREIHCLSQNMSVGGMMVETPEGSSFGPAEAMKISFPMQTGESRIPGRVSKFSDNRLRIQFAEPDLIEQETITRALYSRANSWISTRKYEVDQPMRSLARVIRLSFTGFRQVIQGLMPRRKHSAQAAKVAATTAAALLLVGLLMPARMHAQSLAHMPLPVQSDTGTGAVTGPVASAASSNVMLTAPDAAPLSAPDANYHISFKDMGVKDSIPMNGPHMFYSLGFVLAHTSIPQRATLNLAYRFNAGLAQTGSIKVSLNQVPIATITPPADNDGSYGVATIPVPAEHLVRNNQLTFEYSGGRVVADAKGGGAAANLGAGSQLLVAGETIVLKRDLGLLPLPIFDPDLQTTSNITFVLPANPSYSLLQAASIVASWLGTMTIARPPHFTVAFGEAPRGNVIVFNDSAAGGPMIRIAENASDPEGNALIISGGDDDQLLVAARKLAMMKGSKSLGGAAAIGESLTVSDDRLPAPREPDDAPRWLQTNNLLSLWSLSSADALKSDGSRPVPVYFRVPPDLDYGETQNLNLHLEYAYKSDGVANGSALHLAVNGVDLSDVPLPPGAPAGSKQRDVVLPVANMRPFGNTLLVNFELRPNDLVSHGATGEILKPSYLDIRELAHRAKMPNLELFANAGFPFTRRADLADTIVVMPANPTSAEIALLLYLMSHCGIQTGYPVLRVGVAGPDATMQPEHDYLVLGGVADQPVFGWLDSRLPVGFDSEGVHAKNAFGFRQRLLELRRQLLGSLGSRFSGGEEPTNADGVPDVVIQGIESPVFAGRSIVTVAMRNDEAVEQFAEVFFERSQSSDIGHSVSLLRHGAFRSYDVPTARYHVGTVKPYALMRVWLTENFWTLFGAVMLLSLVVARYARDYLDLLIEARLQER